VNLSHHQHQNFAERKKIGGDTKRLTDAIMDCTGTQASFWLLCLLYVVFLLNQLASDALDGLTPIEVVTGQRPDISALLQFRCLNQSSILLTIPLPQTVLSNLVAGLALPKPKGMGSLTLSSQMIHRRSLLVLQFALLLILPIPTFVPGPIPLSFRLLQAGLAQVPVQVMGSLHLHPSSFPLWTIWSPYRVT
jgi:hypothetical protein